MDVPKDESFRFLTLCVPVVMEKILLWVENNPRVQNGNICDKHAAGRHGVCHYFLFCKIKFLL